MEGSSVCLNGRTDPELQISSVVGGDDRSALDASLNHAVLLAQFKVLVNVGDYEGAASLVQAAYIVHASKRDLNGASALKICAADFSIRSHAANDPTYRHHIHRKRCHVYYSWLESR